MDLSKKYFKLIITGAVNSGKTTFVKAISEIEPISTEAPVSEAKVQKIKKMTTVAFDYGRLTIDDEYVLNIYGTPGQARFNFVWDALAVKAIGVIFLVDSSSEESILETLSIYDYFSAKFNLPSVVAVTKLDLENAISFEDIQMLLNLNDEVIIPCQATEKEQVKNVLIALMNEIMKKENINFS
ncbi:small GTP-binding protein [Chloroherpeton thalassium ATCC 35110]|uniref:Small GTP-binding protein n=1 Tax=Chloroherpeton thalassium (strain ATCC 35110 / GB-78) TaxID=517418 RepID=B3QVT9_CHLT3|nr:ATP/GTP-binding protein [Chloroherpeton thalassium]ACF13146.1 small GTP-binding protein [Chloroherpeton thalassium ATCC 35110]